MRNAMKIAAALVIISSAAACAGKPKPAPEVVQPPPAPPPAPPPVVQPSGPTPGSLEDFRLSVGDRVYFDYDQFSLRGDARDTLQKQAAWLQRYPGVRVLVAGNADERGTREYNLALGARRAAATKDFLVSLGVAANRIETVSYGKERPLNAGSNEDAWAQNRNGHTQIVSGAIS